MVCKAVLRASHGDSCRPIISLSIMSLKLWSAGKMLSSANPAPSATWYLNQQHACWSGTVQILRTANANGLVVGTHCDSWMCCRQDRGCSPITNVCEMWAGAQIVSLSVVSFGSLSRSAAATSRAEWISVSSSGQDPTARAGNDVRNQTPC